MVYSSRMISKSPARRAISVIPESLTRYASRKAPSLEGISLTVVSINGNEVEIAIIPHTLGRYQLPPSAVPQQLKSTS